MSCNSCSNFRNDLCHYPRYGVCNDCLREESISSWKEELKVRKSQSEERKRRLKKYYEYRTQLAGYGDPYLEVQKLPDHTHDIIISLNGGKKFKFNTDKLELME